MKLSILTAQEKEADAMRILCEETTSIGFRRYSVDKIALKRELKCVETPYGHIEVKCSFFEGKMVKYKAEYEQCKIAALAHNVPITKIYESITHVMSEFVHVSKI